MGIPVARQLVVAGRALERAVTTRATAPCRLGQHVVLVDAEGHQHGQVGLDLVLAGVSAGSEEGEPQLVDLRSMRAWPAANAARSSSAERSARISSYLSDTTAHMYPVVAHVFPERDHVRSWRGKHGPPYRGGPSISWREFT